MATKPYYLLCVYHDEDRLRLIAAQVEDHFRHFCNVFYARNAVEGMACYRDLTDDDKKVWLVISAQHLPDMPGDQFLSNIRDRDRRTLTLLLADQPLASEPATASINHAGLSYYLQNPWNQEDLGLVLQKLKTHYQMTTVLNEMNLRFASSIDLDETLSTVLDNILNVMQAEAGSIFLLDEPQEHLVCKMSRGQHPITGITLPVGTGIVGRVAQTGQVDVSEDVKSSTIHHRQVDQQSGLETRSMASVPLRCQAQVLGVMQIVNKQGGKRFTPEDIELLQALSYGAALSIQNAQYSQRLVQEERLRSELRFAREIQQGILPETFVGHAAIHFEAENLPATGVAGDFYDYFQISAYEFVFVIGDACGHGMASAIYTMSARSMIKAQAYADPTPTQVFQLVNTLLEEDAQLGMYLTAFYGVYNTKTGGLRFINAGHTPALLYRPAAAARPASCASLCNVNFALGMFPFVEFEEAAIQLAPGDVVVLYTDGVNEATNNFDEPFGMERLIRVVLEHGNQSPKVLKERIIGSVRAFTGGQEQRDDITVLVVQV